MKMNWGIVGDLIGKAAPVIGGLVGGRLGAEAGGLVASVLGCDNNPEAVANELKNNPEAYVKLKAAQLTHKKELAELAFKEKELLSKERIASIEAGSIDLGNVNTTMGLEAGSSDPWTRRWRPFWGFASAVAFFVCCVGLMIIVWTAVKEGDTDAMGSIASIVSSMAMLFSIPGAILGVASWHRGQKQRIEAGEIKGAGITGALASVIGRVGRQ